MIKGKDYFDSVQCQDPNCTTDHHDAVFLHGRCHMKAPSVLVVTEGIGVASVQCSACRKEIVAVAIRRPTHNELIEDGIPKCHPLAGLWCSYRDGNLNAECAFCKSVRFIAEVAYAS